MTFVSITRKKKKKKNKKNSADSSSNTATQSNNSIKGKKKRTQNKDKDDSSDSPDQENSNETRRRLRRSQSLDSFEQNSNNQTARNQNLRKIDPVLERDINSVVNWSSDAAATLISKRAVEGGKPKGDLSLQNEANAIVWFNTLFKQNNDSSRRSVQDEILQDQQDYLKRHFLAMASLGIQGGNQNDASTYRPLEEFTTNNGNQVNLATVSSGGGRFNYRSQDGSGTDFNEFLLYDDKSQLEQNPQPLQRNGKAFPQSYKQTPPTSYLGAFERISTHNETFDTTTNTIKEGSNKTGKPAIGFDIPIGGVGQQLTNHKGNAVTTDYQGRTTDGDYQTGTVLQRHAEQGDLTSTLVAFEGSGPGQNNIYGGSHGALATVGKVLGITKSTHTLTGQGKRSTWGLKHKDEIDGITKNGGLKADITNEKLEILKQQWELVKNMDSERQQDFYKRLLLTKTQQERTALFNRFRIPTTIAAPQPSASSTTTSNPPTNQSSSDSQPSIPAPPVINDEEITLVEG
ncbi:MAG: hypothetical protein AAGG00_19990 [Cyanobacteria bacterium P01_H01_bin.150]